MAEHDHEFLTVDRSALPPDVAVEAAAEIETIYYDVEWPDGTADFFDRGEDDDIHPSANIDLSDQECLLLFMRHAPMLHGVLTDLLVRPTKLENTKLLPVANLGRITINVGWAGLRSGWHQDYVAKPVDGQPVPDQVSRLIYLTGEGVMQAVTPYWEVEEWGPQGSLMELYNPASAPLFHQGRTTGDSERLAVGFQQPAERILPGQ